MRPNEMLWRFSHGKLDWSTLGDLVRNNLGVHHSTFVGSHKDLGVICDTKWKFQNHVHTVV